MTMQERYDEREPRYQVSGSTALGLCLTQGDGILVRHFPMGTTFAEAEAVADLANRDVGCETTMEWGKRNGLGR